jgi:hypothetical protein
VTAPPIPIFIDAVRGRYIYLPRVGENKALGYVLHKGHICL